MIGNKRFLQQDLLHFNYIHVYIHRVAKLLKKLHQIKTIWLHFQSLSHYPPHSQSRHLQSTTRTEHRFLRTAKKRLIRSTFSSDTRGRPALVPLQRHPVIWNCWYKRLMLLRVGGSLWHCRRKARWTENWFMLRKLQHTKRFLLRSRHFLYVTSGTEKERGGVGLLMRSKLEYLLFRSMWETYFCVYFQSRYEAWERSNHFGIRCNADV
jgi:hypothetical protein